MYVVTVTFEVHADQVDAFRPLMLKQAETSVSQEPGCQQFDVATDPQRPTVFYLYELYTDRAAFDAHLASSHFVSFDAAVQPMLTGKTVQTFDRIGGWQAN
jgi:quinol monooxygenase YgiN